MRSLAIITICLIVVSFEFVHANAFWRSSRFRFSIPIRKKPTTKPTTAPIVSYLAPVLNPLPLCEGELDVDEILRQGATKGRVKRQTTSWPYECTFPSIVNYKGNYDFITEIYSCCQACEHPAFTDCASKNPSPYWVCPSTGMHCIVSCVTKNNPYKKITISKPSLGGIQPIQPIQPSVVGGGGKLPTTQGKRKCTKIVTKNGKKCIKQLCVSLRVVVTATST